MTADPPLYRGPLTPAEDMAEAIVAAIDSDRFGQTTRARKDQG